MVPQPIDLLAVASWYPSRLDPIAGRFVADQLEALAASGQVRPSAVSFEPAVLIGSGALRSRIAALVGELAADPVRAGPELFLVPAGAPGAAFAPPVPLARLTIPSGRNPAAGALHGAVARDGAMAALAERFEQGREHDVPRPSIVHAHTVYPDGAAAATLARRLGARLVLTEHASFVARLIAEPAVRVRYEATVAAAERLVVVSRALAGELVAALPVVEPKVTVIPNGIPVESFPLVARGDRAADELIFVGYRKASKGIETLLRAFAVVVAERPSASLRLVGSSPSDEIERGWHRLAAELGIGAAVRFDPAADRGGVNAALARASLFVHPSPRETFGVVAVEALATGLPVVAADSGGVTEILGDEPDALGALVPRDDHRALAAGILGSLDRIGTFDPGRLRASIIGRFDEATVARRLTDLYREVLERQTHPGSGPALPAAAPGPMSPSPGAAAIDRWRVLVAIDPDRAALVSQIGGEVRARLVLVTSSGPPEAVRAGFGAVVEADLQGRVRALADAAALGPPSTGVRRVLRAIRHPLAVARRRGWLPGLERLVQQRGARAIRAAIAVARERGSDSIEIICLDGLDHLAAGPVLEAGEARLAAGGLRRLGDEA